MSKDNEVRFGVDDDGTTVSRVETDRQFWREGEGWVDHVLIYHDEHPRKWRHRRRTITTRTGEWAPGASR